MVLLDVVSFLKATGHFIAASHLTAIYCKETTKTYCKIWALKLMAMHRMASFVRFIELSDFSCC